MRDIQTVGIHLCKNYLEGFVKLRSYHRQKKVLYRFIILYNNIIPLYANVDVKSPKQHHFKSIKV